MVFRRMCLEGIACRFSIVNQGGRVACLELVIHPIGEACDVVWGGESVAHTKHVVAQVVRNAPRGHDEKALVAKRLECLAECEVIGRAAIRLDR